MVRRPERDRPDGFLAGHAERRDRERAVGGLAEHARVRLADVDARSAGGPQPRRQRRELLRPLERRIRCQRRGGVDDLPAALRLHDGDGHDAVGRQNAAEHLPETDGMEVRRSAHGLCRHQAQVPDAAQAERALVHGQPAKRGSRRARRPHSGREVAPAMEDLGRRAEPRPRDLAVDTARGGELGRRGCCGTPGVEIGDLVCSAIVEVDDPEAARRECQREQCQGGGQQQLEGPAVPRPDANASHALPSLCCSTAPRRGCAAVGRFYHSRAAGRKGRGKLGSAASDLREAGMVRAIVLYDDAPDPERYEQHAELCRKVPGATFRHGPVFGAPMGDPAYALLRGVGVPGPGRVQGRVAQRGVHGDRQGRDGDGRSLHRHVRRRL